MFSNQINTFSNIPTSIFNTVCKRTQTPYDNTLFATSLLLLHNRVNHLVISYSKLDPRYTNPDMINADPEEYSFIWFPFTEKNPDIYLSVVKNKFKEIKSLPMQEKFFANELKTKIYFRIMPKENTVCIFTEEDVTSPVWHAIQFLLPVFFPILKEKPLSEEEKNFLLTLTQKKYNNYVEAANNLADTESFKRFTLGFNLSKFEKKLYEMKLTAAQNNLKKIEADMANAMSMYRDACSKRLDAVALIYGLETMKDRQEERTELQEYLLNNPRITNVNLTDSHIKFIVKTELTPYLADDWEIMSENEENIARLRTADFTNAEVKILLDSFLSNNRCLKLKMCAYFDIDYFGSSVESSTGYAFNFNDYIPNPHLDRHNCFGQNKTVILDQLRCGDIIGAIECCISCAQKINIHEGITFRPFIQRLLNTTGKCFVANDGTELTPREAVDYLIEKQRS